MGTKKAKKGRFLVVQRLTTIKEIYLE